jgi:hypothetical protein
MDDLRVDDVNRSLSMTPAQKLAQALELMAVGLRLKRAAIRAARPGASEAEIDREFELWLFAGG